VIGSYKSAVTKEINKIMFFEWQKSFFNEIIKNEKEYLVIKKYIANNPKESVLE